MFKDNADLQAPGLNTQGNHLGALHETCISVTVLPMFHYLQLELLKGS